MYLILLQARAFFQAALGLAPHMYEPHYNWAALADQVRVHHGAPSLCCLLCFCPPPPVKISSLTILGPIYLSAFNFFDFS